MKAAGRYVTIFFLYFLILLFYARRSCGEAVV
ncbi:MAG TPA: hypothetical protein DEB17_01415 [Chlorobaculum sp.]|uniref:Uncharacterized protein n=1 Tax=Chlorobaculum tepidum (strain ATCC 49652 / DSM 12025 / NBRC 103806 / TLS) TaxID=194439 RepID=Q8KCG9_CHLTE|nr:hypothetical protein CT1452 [Chlorobaculum tepidum TLS]HBU22658.1 hypothetical protein [Chlorobaculum sp.]